MRQMDQVNLGTDGGVDIPYLHVDAAGAPLLSGGRCTECNTVYFPPAGICPACASEAQVREELPQSATVYSQTTVHVAPRPWSTPYTVGYVDLPNGVRLFSHLEGGPQIGDEVRLATGIVGTDVEGAPIRAFVFQKAGE